jgi:hypothetical protein
VTDSDSPTIKRQDVPMALVIGGDEALLRRLSEAALTAQVLLAECSTADATNTTAKLRPLVMIFPEIVYAFDPEGFEALARDVQAAVLRVNSDAIDRVALENELIALMMESELRREQQG